MEAMAEWSCNTPSLEFKYLLSLVYLAEELCLWDLHYFFTIRLGWEDKETTLSYTQILFWYH